MLKTLTAMALVALIAHPAAAQDAATPSLSEQAMKAVELRVRAERWGKIADRSRRVFGLASGAGLVMAGITAERPEQSRYGLKLS